MSIIKKIWWLSSAGEVVTFSPEISYSSLEVGSTLIVYPGGGGYVYTYQWKRGASSIGGATSNHYVTVAADYGENITCEVTASSVTVATSAVVPTWSPAVITGDGFYIRMGINDVFTVPVGNTLAQLQTAYSRLTSSLNNFSSINNPYCEYASDDNFYSIGVPASSTRIFADVGRAATVLNQTFSGGVFAWPDDGQPASIQFLVHDVANTASASQSRFMVHLNTSGTITVQYDVASASAATTNSAVFTNGAQASPKHIGWRLTSGGAIEIFVNGVEVAVTGGSLAAITMANYANATYQIGLGFRRTGAATYDGYFSGKLRGFTLQPVAYSDAEFVSLAALSNAVTAGTRNTGLYTFGYDHDIFGDIETSSRIAYYGQSYTLLDGTDTLSGYFDRTVPTYDTAGKLLKIDSVGALTEITLYAAAAENDQHLTPTLYKDGSTYYAFVERNHEGVIDIYSGASISTMTLTDNCGTNNSYPIPYARLGGVFGMTTRKGTVTTSFFRSTDMATFTEYTLVVPSAGYICYHSMPINRVVNGWAYITLNWTKSSGSFAVEKLFLLKTQDWQTFYNYDETYSKNVVSLGAIAVSDLVTYYSYYLLGTDEQAGTSNAALIDKSGNFYQIARRGNGNVNDFTFIKNEGAGFVEIDFTVNNLGKVWGTDASTPPFDGITKTANYFYFGTRVVENSINRYKVYRSNHAFTNIEDLGYLFEGIYNCDMGSFLQDTAALDVNDSFYLAVAQRPTNPSDLGAGRGWIRYKKVTINEAIL